MKCPKCGRQLKRTARSTYRCRLCKIWWRAEYFELVNLKNGRNLNDGSIIDLPDDHKFQEVLTNNKELQDIYK